MRALCCVVCLAVATIFIGVSQAAVMCPCPTAASSVCGGKLDLRFSVSKTGAQGSLSMTHCPFPVCSTAGGGTITIKDPSLPGPLTFPIAGTAVSTRLPGVCSGVDQYSVTTGGRLKYIFGSKATTVLATHLMGPVILSLTQPYVQVIDGNGYAVNAQLTRCVTAKNRKIRCK
jgi:hypothetical protein